MELEQALLENRMRNLLWLLRSAVPSCQVFGLDDAVARVPAKEQSTAETVNGVTRLGKSLRS